MVRTIDAHAEGGSVRLIVRGFPSPRGRTMLEKRNWLLEHADHLRRALLLEPRGHSDLSGAILTEPTSPGSHAGVLFMHNSGVSTMSGHGIIAVATIALEYALIDPGGDGASLVFDTPAGTIRARATFRARGAGEAGRAGEAGKAGEAGTVGETGTAGTVGRDRVDHVSFLNVPSFVLYGGLVVAVGHRRVRVDVAFGGAFYAIVDSESVGLPIDVAHLPELRRAGMEIARAIEAVHQVAHPLEPGLSGIAGTVFTAPPSDERAGLRNVTIFADAQADRSPSGTGTAAVMAVVDAMGLLGADTPFVHESLIGTHLVGRIGERTTVGDIPAIVPEIEGAAWVTGEHTLTIDDSDPMAWGIRV